MAKRSCYRFRILYFIVLFSIVICCSGTAAGFSYHSRSKTDISSIVKALSTTLNLKQFKAFQFQVLVSDQGRLSHTGETSYIYLKQTQHVHLRSYKALLVSGSKTHHRSHISKLEIPSIVVSCSSLSDFPKGNELQMLLPMLRSTKWPVKVSVALPLTLLKSLDMQQRRHVVDILHYIRKSKSFLIVEASVDGEWNKVDGIIQSIISKANLVVSLLSHANVPIILSIKSLVLPSATELSALNGKILASLENYPQISSKLTSIITEASPTIKLHHSLSSRRELLTHFNHKSILHDSLYPPSTIPTSPVYNPTTPITNPTAPTNIPPYNPTPTIVTIPGTNPVSVTPPSPAAAFPYTTPVPVTPTGPSINPVAPITDPGTQPVTNPVTNPVTTYPPPSTVGGVPSTTTPVTTPVSTPGTAGQSWCIAKNGAPETALQSALDYACGIGGADCATIQEGASCYNPNTLENHASYAFNSYYQKNPTATSCDFGGAAVIVNSDPSSGTCVYPSSATTAAPSIIPPATTAAPSTVPPATTASTSGETGTGSSYGTPPSVLNSSSSPTGSATGYGFENPPIVTAPPSGSAGVQTFFGSVVLATSLAMAVLLGV